MCILLLCIVNKLLLERNHMRIASNNAEAALLMAAYHVRVAGIVMHR